MAGTGYDFSRLFNSSILAFSPGSTFLATAYQSRVIVRSTSNLSIVRTYQCLSASQSAGPSRASEELSVEQLLWSSDGRYLLSYGRGNAWVFGLAVAGDGEGGEMVRIGGGVEGLIKVEWAKGGHEVLAWSEHGLRLTIYNLETGEVGMIQYPKSPETHTWSPDGRYLSVVERHSGRDHLGIYDSFDSFSLLRHFPLHEDTHLLSWSPCGRYIATADNHLHYAAHIYSPLGPCLTHFTPASTSFGMNNEDPGLGIRIMAWALGGRFLALGGWDGRVRVLDNDGWGCVAVMQWGNKTSESGTVWREPASWIQDTRGRGIIQFDRLSIPAPLQSIRPDLSKSHPKMGITDLSFNSDSSLLLIRKEDQPCVIHIHTFLPSPGAVPNVTHLTSISFSSIVRNVSWAPKGKRLAVVTRTGGVYIWDGESGWVDGEKSGEEEKGGLMEGIGIPSLTPFVAHDIHWAPDGQSLVVQDTDHFCLLYDDESDEKEKHGSVTGEKWEEGLTVVCEEEEFSGVEMSDWNSRLQLEVM
ncbi:hypothetical protein TREMEDRAFT_42179 [Tremella mesenterica DSM 1558]|uniref:uncharacterized protein n=1 Tax=Tremella mesenterica (strain ATCC 24925 / CBS 8224 / DSM 1558 / NBRC 9311 / NRRL Y-6157 / RJB 2259-6 / UBC 559-6) TaxID=578456 RepID=UPI0003F496F8|nr:uncharacterized protein TREMEDRAFT_42179 [Tremella mesenterica DSM 1558]EIW73103.1 hypothetical protein TREMEDRAFT_42179 [Tremella mesenterica DSM 1558]